MERVHCIAQTAISETQWIAVVIGEPDQNQRHIGICHRMQGIGLKVLHLAWHCILQNDTVLPHYFTVWIAPPILPERQRHLAAICRRVWKKNQAGGIPYAFSQPREAFDPTTSAFLMGPTRFGLTCASFVLALFEHAGLSVAELDSWPAERAGDREWQKEIVEKLKVRATSEHIAHLQREIGAVRYRPEEVAAAASIAPPPAKYEDIVEISQGILGRIRDPGG